MVSRAIGEPEVSGGGVESERRWPRARVSERRAVASRAIGKPEVSGGGVEGERRWPRAGVSERWR